MLTQLGRQEPVTVTLGTADPLAPFQTGLEFAAPARGVWNICHTGMLVPESHQIYVCAAGCLRGVVLTAAEMGAAERFSSVEIRENNVLDGDMEELMLEGVTDVLRKLPVLPKAVLVYTSCIHHFMACDLTGIYAELRRRFPDTRISDFYMNPIMRKSGLTPEQLTRRQIYSFLDPRPHDPKAVNIIGSDLPTLENADFLRLLRGGGITVRDITACKTFEEYLRMAEGSLNLVVNPAAIPAAEALKTRLGQPYVYLPQSFDADTIRSQLRTLSEMLALPLELPGEDAAEQALARAKAVIGSTPIAIDYTSVFRPLELARMLLRHGFAVTDIYLDCISPEEPFAALQKEHPELRLHPTVHPEMRRVREADTSVLAIGQKAAYFSGTTHFINMVEGGGLHGFGGIETLAGRMIEAFETEKRPKDFIQIKGLGCHL